MPKAPNPLHGDQISTAQARIAKSVIGRNARAEKRGGLCGSELIRNRSEGARFSDHHFRISPIHSDARHHGVLTIHDVSASAWFAHPVFSGNEADTNSLTDFPSGHPAAHSINAADDFMSGHPRQSQTRVDAGDRRRIGVTDSACLHPNANLARSGFRHLAFHYSKLARLIYFDCLVCVFHVNFLLIFKLVRSWLYGVLCLFLPQRLQRACM
jgi:hypothetical protein